MKIKTSELTGPALDWLVAKCEDPEMATAMAEAGCIFEGYHYSTDWAQGGPIIEREEIDIYCYTSPKNVPEAGLWAAEITGTNHKKRGPTPLIAAMRCLVTSKLGDKVEVPEELK